MRPIVSLVARVAIFVAASSVGSAAKNYLPDRDKPVPADQPIPTVDFVRPPLLENPVLSPDGTYFAAFTKNEELKSAVLICEIATGKILWNRRGCSTRWISNRHILANSSWGAIDVRDPDHGVDVESVVGKNRFGFLPESGHFRISHARTAPNFNGAKIDRKWYSPQDGELTYCLYSKDDGRRVLYRYDDRKWVECPIDIEEITPLEIGQKINELIVLGPSAKGQPRAIQRMDAATGALGQVIYRDAQRDCLPWVHFRRDTREIDGVSVGREAVRDVWLSETKRNVQKLIDEQFKGALARIASSDRAETKFLIEVQSDRQPPTYYFLDTGKMSLGLLKNTSPWIDPARMQPTRIMNYKTRDGVLIEGFLTLPAGTSKEHPAPLVVTPHAGPWGGRDAWGWESFRQLVANRGYACFEPNYRGSAGYDSRCSPEDRFDFQKMCNDVSDGVAALRKTGLIDTERVATCGIGFGSYLALLNALEKPGVFRCALALGGGVFDWEKAFRKVDASNWHELRWLERRLKGHNFSPPSVLARTEEIHFPVFITRNFERFPDITTDSQSWELFRALKDRTICVNFGDLQLYTENEAYSEVVDRFDAILKFLDTHMAKK